MRIVPLVVAMQRQEINRSLVESHAKSLLSHSPVILRIEETATNAAAGNTTWLLGNIARIR